MVEGLLVYQGLFVSIELKSLFRPFTDFKLLHKHLLQWSMCLGSFGGHFTSISNMCRPSDMPFCAPRGRRNILCCAPDVSFYRAATTVLALIVRRQPKDGQMAHSVCI